MVDILNPPVQTGDSFSTRYEGSVSTTETSYKFPSVQDSIVVHNRGFSYITATVGSKSVRVEPNGGYYRFTEDADTVLLKASFLTSPFILEGKSMASGQGTGIDTVARTEIGTISSKINKPKTVEQVIEKMINKQPVTIVCYGDSITLGYVPVTGAITANPYPAYLQTLLRDYYGYTGITVYNHGNSGKQSDEFASDSYIDAVKARNPDMIIFMCGINDCSGGTSGGDIVPVLDYKNNIATMVSKLDYPFIFMTPTFFQAPEERKSRFNQYVEAMKEMAKKLSVNLIDLNAIVLKDLEVREIAFEDVAPDNIHYVDSYYKRIAEFVFAFGLTANDILVSGEKFINPLDSLFRWKSNNNYYGSSINPLKKNLWLDNANSSFNELTLWLFIGSRELALQTIYVTNVSTSPNNTVEVNGVSYPQYTVAASGQTIFKLRAEQIPLEYGLNKIVYKTSNVTGGKLLNLIYGAKIAKKSIPVFGEEKKYVGAVNIKADTTGVQKRTKLLSLDDNNFKKLIVKFTPTAHDAGLAFGTGSAIKDGSVIEYPLGVVLQTASNVIKLYDMQMNNNTALLNPADGKLNFAEKYSSALAFNMSALNTLTVTLNSSTYTFELNGALLFTADKNTLNFGVMDVWGYSVSTASFTVNEVSVSS